MTSHADQRPQLVASRRASSRLVLGAIAGVGLCFYCFDPGSHAFYLPCLLHRLTGLECPACGSQRALHQLLRGNFDAAVQLNPLFVALLPLLMWYGARTLLRMTSGWEMPMVCRGRAWLWLLVIVIVTFGVYRNLHASFDGSDKVGVRSSRAPPR